TTGNNGTTATSNNDAFLNGNLSANQAAHAATITGISWGVGQDLVLRWTDFNESNNDDLVAMDNLTFTAPTGPAVPTAFNDSATATKSLAKSINVLSNDFLNGATALQVVSSGVNGATVTVNTNNTIGVADDSITYTGASTFAGTDTFTYRITDGTNAR